MEDPRCRIAAKRPEDLRIRHISQILGAAVDIEYTRFDTPYPQYRNQHHDIALGLEDLRCQRPVTLTEDPRCAGLGLD